MEESCVSLSALDSALSDERSAKKEYVLCSVGSGLVGVLQLQSSAVQPLDMPWVELSLCVSVGSRRRSKEKA